MSRVTLVCGTMKTQHQYEPLIHDTSTPHRWETNRFAERAVTKEQEGTAATFDRDWSLQRVVERSDGVLLSVAERSQGDVGW